MSHVGACADCHAWIDSCQCTQATVYTLSAQILAVYDHRFYRLSSLLIYLRHLQERRVYVAILCIMEGQNQNDELYPIAVLIDELKVLSLYICAGAFKADIPLSMMMFFYGLTRYTDCLQ